MKVIKTLLNSEGFAQALSRINAGDVDKSSQWAFSVDDANKLLGTDKSLASLAHWYLGADSTVSEKSTEYFKYPFGKNGKVYRSALLAIRQRASQEGDETIYRQAGVLIDKLDGAKTTVPASKQLDMRQQGWATFELLKSYEAKDAGSGQGLDDPNLENCYIIEGIATTINTDRMGDIVMSEGASYKLPIPYLWQHNNYAPVGNVVEAKATKEGIWSRTAIPKVDVPGAVKDRIDEAIQSIRLKLVRGQSIGFSPIEYAWMDDTGGYRFMRWEWLELSAVTIPANQDANIETIKAFDLARMRKQYQPVVKLSQPIARGGIIRPTLKESNKYGQTHCDTNSQSVDEILEVRRSIME